ncbi:MAG TPA: hypothetical protein VL221_12530 [Bacteroidota bacterium]|nr:hypothetical protein [Bacteroidota bacterium]
MEIPLEKLVEIVVTRVLAELSRQGLSITGGTSPGDPAHHVPRAAGHGTAARHDPISPVAPAPGTRLEPDFTGYKTPVLNESRVRGAGPHIREIVVPAGTVVTAGARDLLEQRRLQVTFSSTHS